MKIEPMDELALRNRSLQVKLRDCERVMDNLRQSITELEAAVLYLSAGTATDYIQFTGKDADRVEMILAWIRRWGKKK